MSVVRRLLSRFYVRGPQRSLAIAGIVAGSLLLSGCALSPVAPSNVGDTTDANAAWDASNIFSDAVFFNAFTMTPSTIQTFLDAEGCSTSGCLGKASYTWPGATVPWCKPVGAGSGSFAQMLSIVTLACGINPQVALIMIQKESQGWTRDPVPAALTGFACPDSGPGGSANCASSASGVWSQTWGMVSAFARVRSDPSRLNYPVGVSKDILWNVAETGCGTAPVTPENTATALIYTYTPYQPNAAALASYPGVGDACSAVGNRNLFRMFQHHFGSTGGGVASNVSLAASVTGTSVPLPSSEFVTAIARGQTVTAPTAGVAAGIAAGLTKLGLPYVWGGGDGLGGAEDRGSRDANSAPAPGFDCSGLTAFVTVAGGGDQPGSNSGAQRSPGHAVPWGDGKPGDIIGFPGHVAIYLGTIGGKQMILEASTFGVPVHVVPLTRTDHDDVMYRYWH